MSVGRILFGYYLVPESAAQPIDFTVNPEGLAVRSAKRVWNDGKTQLIVLSPRARQSGIEVARTSVDLVRMPSSKLVSCGSLLPWSPDNPPTRTPWCSSTDGEQDY